MSENIHNRQVFSLKEVLSSVQKTLEKRYQSAYWMKAEMNKLNFYSYSGHCYPDLLEKKEGKVIAQARAVMWAGIYQTINEKFLSILKEPLKDGINILFLAKITFTPVHGLSLQILDIDPSYSLGVLEKEKLENINQLKTEGLYNQNKTLPLPLLPQRIAIISVETSKGYSDFLKIIDRNPKGYQFHYTLFPARLQGDWAIKDIAKQIKNIASKSDQFDVITIIRGGGGDVGLSAFNDYNLAKTIATSPLPVLTGIGHSTNETISEMVAFKNTITPTECGQFFLDRFEDFDLKLRNFWERISRLTTLKLNYEREQQKFFITGIQKANRRYLRQNWEDLHQSATQLPLYYQRLVAAKKEEWREQGKRLAEKTKSFLLEEQKTLDQTGKHINLVDPKNILKRGFSITRHNGKVITTQDEIPEIGDEIETELFNTVLKSTVKEQKEK